MPKWKIIGGYLAGVILIAFLSWTYFNVKKEKEILRASGEITNGMIVKTVNRKRGLDIQYEFFVSGNRYLSWYKVYKDMRVGETFDVTYYPEDPTINRPTFALNKE